MYVVNHKLTLLKRINAASKASSHKAPIPIQSDGVGNYYFNSSLYKWTIPILRI